MNREIAEEPLARALLRHLAVTRSKGDPLGSLARTVVSGDSTLRAAADDPWHREGLSTSLAAAQAERSRMTTEQRAEYERDAKRLRGQINDHNDGGDQ
ncbi:MAG TPA: hypothetical protein VFG99_09550, partial [Chloroflexia bacterium]|nr:hypothetical protein [Chloroflexia bacterium]